MRYYVAARVSTDGQEDGQSLPQQLEAGKAYVERMGGVVVKEGQESVSGATPVMQRPTVQEMVQLAMAGQIDAVVWAKNDRMHRSREEAAALDNMAALYGLQIHLAETGPRNVNTAAGVMQAGMFDTVSESERIRILERTTDGRHDGVKELATTDKAPTYEWLTGGQPPLGYYLERQGKRSYIKAQPAEVEVVQRMYELAAQGLGVRQIANTVSREFADWRRTGRLPKRKGGKGYSNQAVYCVLERDYYHTGRKEVWVRATVMPKAVREQFKNCEHAKVKGETCMACGRTRMMVPVPVILNAGQVAAARDRFRKSSRKAAKTIKYEAHEYGLPGDRIVHVHPSGFEAVMYGMTRKDHKNVRSYRCQASVERRGQFGVDDPERCPGFGNVRGKRRTSIWADKVDASLLRELLARLHDEATYKTWLAEEGLAQLTGTDAEGMTTADRLTMVREEIDSLGRKLARAEDAWLEDKRSDEWYQARKDDLEPKLADLRGREALLAQEALEADHHKLTVEKLMGMTVQSPAPGTVGEHGDFEEPGWSQTAEWLDTEAQGVLNGSRADLTPNAIGWLQRLVEVFDVKVRLHDVGHDLPHVEATGTIPLGALPYTGTMRDLGCGGVYVEDSVGSQVTTAMGK